MCGRYYIDPDMMDEMQKIVPGAKREIWEGKEKQDIYPTNTVPVIEKTEEGLKMSRFKWGYPGIQGKGVLINARAETVIHKPLFRQGITRHRIVIPASGFYEWNRNKEKSTFTGENSRILFMAGFYDCFSDENRFVILTTAANESMIEVHERMPLIIEKKQLEQWFDDERMEELLYKVPPLLCRTTEYEQLYLFS